jgi:hypothetical protein
LAISDCSNWRKREADAEDVSWRKRLIGSKLNTASISTQACASGDNKNGRRLQVDPIGRAKFNGFAARAMKEQEIKL